MSDLIERLEDVRCNREPFTPEHADCICLLTGAAAFEITRLKSVIQTLLEAIGPFAAYHEWATKWEWPAAVASDDGTPILGRDNYDADNPPSFTVNVGAFRRALDAKTKAEDVMKEKD